VGVQSVSYSKNLKLDVWMMDDERPHMKKKVEEKVNSL
jgi:hypothetical protein